MKGAKLHLDCIFWLYISLNAVSLKINRDIANLRLNKCIIVSAEIIILLIRTFRKLDLVYNAIVANKDLVSFVQETINYIDSFGRPELFSNKIINKFNEYCWNYSKCYNKYSLNN